MNRLSERYVFFVHVYMCTCVRFPFEHTFNEAFALLSCKPNLFFFRGCHTSSLTHLNMEIFFRCSTSFSCFFTKCPPILSYSRFMYTYFFLDCCHLSYILRNKSTRWKVRKILDLDIFYQFFQFKWNRAFASKIATRMWIKSAKETFFILIVLH